MNLLTKTVILLVLFNRLEASDVKDSEEFKDWKSMGCQLSFLPLLPIMIDCIQEKFTKTRNIATKPQMYTNDKAVPGQLLEGNYESELCCYSYYKLCITTKTVRRECNPSSGFDHLVKKHYQNLTDGCTPSKELCDKYIGTVKGICGEFTYSECDSHTWSSFSPISVNGWALCLSLFVLILIVV